MGRDDYSQSSQLSTLVGKPVSRYTQLPKNTNTLRKLTEAKAKPNNRYHYSIYPAVESEYQASYSQLTNLDFYSPIITILGDNPYAHLVNTPFTDPGITLDEGSTLVSNVSTVNTNAFGTFKITYVATDGINPDTTRVRTVKVGEFPDVTIDGDNPYVLERYDQYIDDGVTINDSNSTVRSTTITVNNTQPGNYTVNYTVANEVFSRIYSRSVKVVDTSPPVVTVLGDNPYTLERFEVYTDPGATGDLGTTVTTDLSNLQNTSIGSFVVVYNATDGNTAHDVAVTRTVNVVDTVPPVVTIVGDNPYTLERFDPYVDPGATVDRGTTLTTDLTAVNNTLAHGASFVVTYTGSDGNTLHDVTVTRTVNIEDNKPPQLTILGADPYPMQPYGYFPDLDPGFEVDLGTSVSINYSNVNTNNVDAGFQMVVYTASDGVHPDVVKTRIVAVADTVSPVITITGDNPYTLERYAEYVDDGATVDAGSTLETANTVSTVDNTAVGSYTVTYSATDSTNPDTIAVRIVNVVDTKAPIVTLNGASSVTLERFDLFENIDEGVDIESPGTLVSVDTSQLDNTTQGTYTVTYNVVDDQENANVITREVVVVDTVPPVVTLNNPSTSYSLERYGVWADIDPGVTVDEGSYVDAVNVSNTVLSSSAPVQYVVKDGTNITNIYRTIRVYEIITINGDTSVTTERFGTYNDAGAITTEPGFSVTTDYTNVNTSISHGSSFDVVYTATNGVITRTAIRTVTVLDTTPPVITFSDGGSGVITMERYTPYEDSAPDVTLDEGSYITTIDLEALNNEAVGSYVVTYNASDGVNTTSVNRIVSVVDTNPPVITLVGSNPYYVERFSEFVDPYAYADQGSTMFPADESNVNMSLPYGSTFDIVYRASDINSTTYALRQVIIDDTQEIVASFIGPNPNTHERFDVYSDAGITVDQSASYTIDTTNVNVSDIGSFDIVYNITDGNTAHDISLIRTVNVVDTRPILSIMNGDNPYYLDRYDEYNDAGLTVDPGTIYVTDTSNVNNLAVGVYDVAYEITDGNTAHDTSLTRSVRVRRQIDPVITITGSNPYYHQLGNVYNDIGFTTDGYADIVTTDTSNVNINTRGSYDVVYTATDDLDSTLTTTSIRTVIVDSPIITLNLHSTSPYGFYTTYKVLTDTPYIEWGATSDGGETVNIDATAVDTNTEGTYTVTYSATDSNGLYTEESKNVKVADEFHQTFAEPFSSPSPLASYTYIYSNDDGDTLVIWDAYLRTINAYTLNTTTNTWTRDTNQTLDFSSFTDWSQGYVTISKDFSKIAITQPYESWGVNTIGRTVMFSRSSKTSSWSYDQTISFRAIFYGLLTEPYSAVAAKLLTNTSSVFSPDGLFFARTEEREGNLEHRHVTIYKYSNGTWSINTTIPSSSPDYEIKDISMSKNGSTYRFAICRVENSINKTRVYQYSSGTTWNEIGTSSFSESGILQNFSTDGNTLVYIDNVYDPSGGPSYLRYVVYKTYRYNGGSWNVIGGTSDIEVPRDSDGGTESKISHDGNDLFIRSTGYFFTGVRHFRYSSSTNSWTRLGDDESTSAVMNFGYYDRYAGFDISSDGTKIFGHHYGTIASFKYYS